MVSYKIPKKVSLLHAVHVGKEPKKLPVPEDSEFRSL